MPFILLVSLLLLFPCLLGASPFIVNANEEVGNTLGKEHVEYLIDQIYAPLGIKPAIVFLPNLRGLHMANTGQIDAEFSRYEQIGQAYPNLLKINEPLVAVNAGLFCMSKEQCTLEQDSVYIRTKRSITLAQFCSENHLACQVVARDDIAFNIMSKRTRIIYLSEYQIAVTALCKSAIKRIYYRHISSLSRFSYHWINARHQSLAPALAASIKQLKQSDTLKITLENFTGDEKPCSAEIIPLPPLKKHKTNHSSPQARSQ